MQNDDTRYVRMPNGEFVPESEADTWQSANPSTADTSSVPAEVPQSDVPTIDTPDAVSSTGSSTTGTPMIGLPGERDDSPSVEDEDDYEYIRLPNGQLRAVPKNQIRDADDAPQTARSDAPRIEDKPAKEDEYYVHLADGSVERVKESDLPPGGAGTGVQHGYWQRGRRVFEVIGVYPVEIELEDGNGS